MRAPRRLDEAILEARREVFAYRHRAPGASAEALRLLNQADEFVRDGRTTDAAAVLFALRLTRALAEPGRLAVS